MAKSNHARRHTTHTDEHGKTSRVYNMKTLNGLGARFAGEDIRIAGRNRTDVQLVKKAHIQAIRNTEQTAVEQGLEDFFTEEAPSKTLPQLEVLAGKINAFYAMDYRREAKKEIKSLSKATLRCILENRGHFSKKELEAELYNDLLMEGSVKILQGALAICGDDEYLTLQFLERELARLNTPTKMEEEKTEVEDEPLSLVSYEGSLHEAEPLSKKARLKTISLEEWEAELNEEILPETPESLYQGCHDVESWDLDPCSQTPFLALNASL